MKFNIIYIIAAYIEISLHALIRLLEILPEAATGGGL